MISLSSGMEFPIEMVYLAAITLVVQVIIIVIFAIAGRGKRKMKGIGQ